MPCASLLVRINLAPKSEDGLRVLSIKDVPEKDWEKLGVNVPPPPYASRVFNTEFCNVRDSEKSLFELR